MPALSGQKTVTTAGTAVTLGSQNIGGPLAVKALPGNTGTIYIGNNGSNMVSSTSGLPLSPGDVIIFNFIGDLAQLYIDSTVDGESVAWMILSV